MRTAGAITVAVSVLGIDAVHCADDEAGNDGDADLQRAEAHAVRTAGAITVAVSALGIDEVDCADGSGLGREPEGDRRSAPPPSC